MTPSDRLEKRVPVFSSVRRLARRRKVTGPLLSVVVPVYRVDAYLDATLANLAAQTYRSIEVIIVDDGSPDRCAEIAQGWADRDPRFTVVRQDNAGPSAARNRGIEHATGELLTFVDGDDLLPPDAWERLVGVLERTGSDFSVGKIERDDGTRRFATRRMERNHCQLRERTTVTQMPEILADVFPVNKVYRRAFWDRLGLAFPEGLFYEDQPVMTVGFLHGVFDVLPDTVYWYRIRQDGSSTTQLRHELKDLTDRMTTKRMTVASVLEYGVPEVTEVFFADVLPVDMWEYFRSSVGADAEYWTILRDAVREFWNEETLPFHRTDVPVQQRLMGWLTVQDRREDLAALIELIDTEGVHTRLEDGVEIFEHPWLDEDDLPAGCRMVASSRDVPQA